MKFVETLGANWRLGAGTQGARGGRGLEDERPLNRSFEYTIRWKEKAEDRRMTNPIISLTYHQKKTFQYNEHGYLYSQLLEATFQSSQWHWMMWEISLRWGPLLSSAFYATLRCHVAVIVAYFWAVLTNRPVKNVHYGPPKSQTLQYWGAAIWHLICLTCLIVKFWSEFNYQVSSWVLPCLLLVSLTVGTPLTGWEMQCLESLASTILSWLLYRCHPYPHPICRLWW